MSLAYGVDNGRTQIVTYPGVNHAFFNASGDNYNKAQAEKAYAKVLDWFGEHLA